MRLATMRRSVGTATPAFHDANQTVAAYRAGIIERDHAVCVLWSLGIRQRGEICQMLDRRS